MIRINTLQQKRSRSVELHSFSFSFSSHIDTAINGTTGEVPENLEEIDPQFEP